MALRPPETLCSLFSGGGGLDLALHRATGARGVVYVEREGFAAASLVARMEAQALDPAPIWDDVATFDGRPWRGVVDLVAGGSPCQDLSVAGNGEGLDGKRSGLFWQMHRIVGEIQPEYVFWENVGGAASALPRVFDAFAELGYRGAWCRIRASDVGATHQRARIFLLAHRDSRRLDPGLVQRLGQHRAPGGTDAQRRGDAAVGDSAGERVEGGGLCRQRRPYQWLPGEAGRPMEFPPGPDDTDGWRRVLATHPELAPAVEPLVCGVADGLALGLVDTRADQLRLLGNGVVPAQAAAAWELLWNAIGGAP